MLIDGRSLHRPINYFLSCIVLPAGIVTDRRKRPVVVVDPRAGQGPGIGGFKAESEIVDGRWRISRAESEMTPAPCHYAMTRIRRTESGRPAASIWFSTATPMAASIR